MIGKEGGGSEGEDGYVWRVENCAKKWKWWLEDGWEVRIFFK